MRCVLGPGPLLFCPPLLLACLSPNAPRRFRPPPSLYFLCLLGSPFSPFSPPSTLLLLRGLAVLAVPSSPRASRSAARRGSPGPLVVVASLFALPYGGRLGLFPPLRFSSPVHLSGTGVHRHFSRVCRLSCLRRLNFRCLPLVALALLFSSTSLGSNSLDSPLTPAPVLLPVSRAGVLFWGGAAPLHCFLTASLFPLGFLRLLLIPASLVACFSVTYLLSSHGASRIRFSGIRCSEYLPALSLFSRPGTFLSLSHPLSLLLP